MTLQQLEYIIALDNHRNFVQAAKHCFVTQPTITLQVKKLEDEIGIQIFDRSRTPLKVTPMGELIVSKARNIVLEAEELKSIIKEKRDNITGHFKIGIIPTIAPYIIPQFIGNFVRKYPETILDIEEMKSEAILDAIKKNTIDIGILVSPLNDSKLRKIPLYNEAFVYYGEYEKNKKEISIEEVENREGLWLLSSGHCLGKQILNICQSETSNNNINFKSGSIETLIKMVDKYGGFTLIPDLVAIQSDKTKTLNFSDPKPCREVSIVVNKGFVKESLINMLRQEILEIVPNTYQKSKRFIKIKWR